VFRYVLRKTVDAQSRYPSRQKQPEHVKSDLFSFICNAIKLEKRIKDLIRRVGITCNTLWFRFPFSKNVTLCWTGGIGFCIGTLLMSDQGGYLDCKHDANIPYFPLTKSI
jgi:hypothetical protein